MADIILAGEGTNSFQSLENADIYFETRTSSEKWTKAEDVNTKKIVLIMGFQRLNMERYEGSKLDMEQNGAFPRTGIVDIDGNAISNDTIPQFVKDAQCEISLTILEDPAWFGDKGTEGWESMQTDGATGRLRKDHRAQELPEIVKRLLQPVLYVDLGYYGIV